MYIKQPVRINGVIYEEWEIKSVCWILETCELTFNIFYYDKDGAGDILTRSISKTCCDEVDVNKLIDEIKAEHKRNIHI